MNYNVINIVDEDLTDTKIEEIINSKLYKIIEFMESMTNIYE